MYDQNPLIEEILFAHLDSLQSDYEKYRNHVYRVFNLSIKFLPAAPLPDDLEILAIASAYHDIGIWTHHTFDYLAPSTALADSYLKNTGRAAWTEAVGQMIGQHHKLSRYQGSHDTRTEAFRKADWTDLSFGLIRFGLEPDRYRSILKAFPTKGFHRFLIRKSLQNLMLHPTEPLPMFKR